MKTVISADPPVNQAPPEVDPARDLPRGFYDFLVPLHRAFSPRQQELAARRRGVLEAAHQGRLPDYLPASEATTGSWKVSLPGWCQDQRNQMTGPADDAELVVKMLNSGAPGVMLDLEDSVANAWPNITQAIRNIIAALRGELTYQDKKRDREVGIKESKTVLLTRPRGLHLEQAGVIKGERMAAALFDVAMVAYQVDPSRLKHPLSIYIAKSESADEALWWRDVFQAVSSARGWPQDYIKCMALVESHPLAYQMEEIAVNQFPYPNQVQARRADPDIHKDLRPSPQGVGKRTLDGTRAAVRTVIRYRNGVLNGKGASLLDGYMEDLATDRIYRYMIAQRMLHQVKVRGDEGNEVAHSSELVSQLFDEELDRLLRESPTDGETGAADSFRKARDLSEGMVLGILQAQGVQIR